MKRPEAVQRAERLVSFARVDEGGMTTYEVTNHRDVTVYETEREARAEMARMRGEAVSDLMKSGGR